MVHRELAKLRLRVREQSRQSSDCDERQIAVYELLLFAGMCLCAAMGVSVVEIVMDRDSVSVWGCFPYLHVTIHVLEQIGIYHYGIGVAALQFLVICEEQKSELRYVAG